ncbi:MAG: acyl-CoA thioesterase [Bacteroidales bacterium]|jgi:acyl-CoA thioester hydrolase|nr:acyl-CoA thioesterase [Bacteroidales bacterium]
MSDLDALGHVNNGVIYSYYDTGRLHYFRQLGESVCWETFDKVVVHTECDFKEPILFQDEIRVETEIIEFGNKSFKMMQQIVDNHTGNVKGTCLSVLSGYDRETHTSKLISNEFKEKAESFQKIE